MRWIIEPTVREHAKKGLEWLKAYLEDFDLSHVDWVRVDLGRGHTGAYGRCWYPVGGKKGFRLSLQVPGPFPCQMLVRRRPIYVKDGIKSRKLLPGEFEGEHIINSKGVQWIRIKSHITLASMDEAVVWVGAHEAFHFLRKSRQIPGKNGEIEADEHADRKLAEYRVTS